MRNRKLAYTKGWKLAYRSRVVNWPTQMLVLANFKFGGWKLAYKYLKLAFKNSATQSTNLDQHRHDQSIEP